MLFACSHRILQDSEMEGPVSQRCGLCMTEKPLEQLYGNSDIHKIVYAVLFVIVVKNNLL